MRVFMGCLGTETNTFSSMPTGLQTFRDTMLYHGDATQHPPGTFSLPLHVWRQKTEERQGEVVEGLAAFAQPAGITVRAVYEGLRDQLLDELRAALPVDIVLLSMHGAMTAEGYEDCEGDLLAQVREIVGPDVVVGGELDLHCSITPQMVENADALVLFKEYPHVDVGERAAELFDICLGKHEGTMSPVMAVHDCRMINMWRTPVEPMKTVVAEMQAAEGKDGVLSVSFAHGFPWQDVPGTSAKMLVISDGDAEKAASIAESFGQRLWDLRGETEKTPTPMDEALDLLAAASEGPMVLADVADNAGGGAPSDSTFLLRAAIEKGITNIVSCHYWDPLAVRFCEEAGEGATLNLRVGGKCGPESGDPLDLRVTINRILHDGKQSFGDAWQPMGTVVWLTADAGVDLVLTSRRTQAFHPNSLEQLGIEPARYRGILLKSIQHFYAGFAPIASEVLYVAAPGAIPPDFANIPYRSFIEPYWPKSEDPFQGT